MAISQRYSPSIPALYAARPGLEIINQAGIDAIRGKSLLQTQRLLELAGREGYRCTTPRDPARRGGTVAIDVENGYEVSQSLKALDTSCSDYRPGAGIRFSPHFYTLDDDAGRRDGGNPRNPRQCAWRAFMTGKSTVT